MDEASLYEGIKAEAVCGYAYIFNPYFCDVDNNPGNLVILDQYRFPVSTRLQFVEIKEKGSSLLVGGENDLHETLMLHLGVLKQTQNITVEGV